MIITQSGTMLYPSEINRLKELIKERKDIKPLITETVTNRKLIDEWWYLAFIVLLFAIEWFERADCCYFQAASMVAKRSKTITLR